MILYAVILVAIFGNIYCEDVCSVLVVDNVKRGFYQAKTLENNVDGKTIEQIYGKLVKVVVPINTLISGTDFTKMAQTYKLQLAVTYKLNKESIGVTYFFENGYAANGYVEKDCISIDAYYFKSP